MPLLPQPAALSSLQTIYGGGALAFQYTFDTSIVNSDPGSGKFRFSSSSFSAGTPHIYLSNVGGQGEDVNTIIHDIFGPGSTSFGIRKTGASIFLRYQSVSDPTKTGMYLIQQYSNQGTYWDLTLKRLASSALPLTIPRDSVISFVISGMPGGPTWNFDTTLYDGATAPPNGTFRMNGTLIGNTSKIGLQGKSGNMGDWSGLFNGLTLTTGPVKLRIVLVNATTLYGGSGTVEFLMYEVNDVVDMVTYTEFDVTYVDSTSVGTEPIGVQDDPIIWFPMWVGVGAKLAPTVVKTGGYAPAANELVPVDTTSAPVTITLPTAPVDGTQITVKCVTRPGSNNVTVAAGGSDVFNKAGGPTTLTLNAVNQGVALQYAATPAIWYVVGSIST